MLSGWRDSAPLCPAGHLPHKGGDWQLRRRRRPTSRERKPNGRRPSPRPRAAGRPAPPRRAAAAAAVRPVSEN
ncbi:MAG: hypothetical protein E5X48_30885 [Mesorhizobium sp.]|nr:MAG: hypothetical protein E5X48_30885 [Mesorhizobium sp.]